MTTLRRVLLINGSTIFDGSNGQLIDAIMNVFSDQTHWSKALDLTTLPLFKAQDDHSPWPSEVVDWRQQVATADACVIVTPEYVADIPAALKNALEWITSSGDIHEKKVLPITFAPSPPRGEHAMRSLLQILQYLNAYVPVSLPMYQLESIRDGGVIELTDDQKEILGEAIDML